jgi:hypothetical protein
MKQKRTIGLIILFVAAFGIPGIATYAGLSYFLPKDTASQSATTGISPTSAPQSAADILTSTIGDEQSTSDSDDTSLITHSNNEATKVGDSVDENNL